MSPPPASLVLCTRDRPRFLLDTLGSILAGEELPAEIVVTDQGDPPASGLDGLGAGLPCTVRHVPLRSVGLGRARNAGIQAARHDAVAFIDDDMWVDRRWWGTLLRALLEAGPRAVITGQVRAAPPEVPGGIAPSTMLGDERVVYEGRLDRDILAAGNMILFRSAFDEVGLFDERLGAGSRFPSSEDNDFCFRLLEAGYRVIYEPGAVLEHRAWRSKQDYVRLRWSYGRGHGAYYAKHLAPGDRRMLGRLRADLARQVRKVPARLRGRELRMLASDVAFALGLTVGAAEWLLTQRKPG
ncbi:MAG: glycosyltransferase family 2 protein [Thermoanaerobaculia bacterium]